MGAGKENHTLLLTCSMNIPINRKDYVLPTQDFDDGNALCSGRENVVHLEKHNLKTVQ